MKLCEECGNPVDLKPGDLIAPEIGYIAPDYGEVELCRACFSKGWSAATATDFFNDPELRERVSILSPIQREDLDYDES